MQASDCMGMHAIASFSGLEEDAFVQLLCAVPMQVPAMIQMCRHRWCAGAVPQTASNACSQGIIWPAERSLLHASCHTCSLLAHHFFTGLRCRCVILRSVPLHCIVCCCVVLCCAVLTDAQNFIYSANTMSVMCRAACHGCNGCWSAPCDSCGAMAVPVSSLQGVPDNQWICRRKVQGRIQAPN